MRNGKILRQRTFFRCWFTSLVSNVEGGGEFLRFLILFGSLLAQNVVFGEKWLEQDLFFPT